MDVSAFASPRKRQVGGRNSPLRRTPASNVRKQCSSVQQASERLRLGLIGTAAKASVERGYETAHSVPALRQITHPLVPAPPSASLTAPPAGRSRHSPPVRCSPKAPLRMRPTLVSMTAPAAPSTWPRGDRYTVTFQPSAARRFSPGCACHQQPQRRGASSCPAPHPRSRDSGNRRAASNWNILFKINSFVWYNEFVHEAAPTLRGEQTPPGSIR